MLNPYLSSKQRSKQSVVEQKISPKRWFFEKLSKGFQTLKGNSSTLKKNPHLRTFQSPSIVEDVVKNIGRFNKRQLKSACD